MNSDFKIPPLNQPSLLVSRRQAAQMLGGVDVSTIRRLERTGLLKPRRLTRRPERTGLLPPQGRVRLSRGAI
jgi:hypothetical protein